MRGGGDFRKSLISPLHPQRFPITAARGAGSFWGREAPLSRKLPGTPDSVQEKLLGRDGGGSLAVDCEMRSTAPTMKRSLYPATKAKTRMIAALSAKLPRSCALNSASVANA